MSKKISYKKYEPLGLKVKPLQKRQIDRIVNNIRDFANENGLIENNKLDLISLIEFIRDHPDYGYISYDVCENTDSKFPDDDCLGLTEDDGSIFLKEDVWEGVVNDEGHHRFTVAHELGHAVLHKGQIRVAFARTNNGKAHEAFEDSEWQANYFAGQLLAPKHLIEDGSTVEDIANSFGISYSCARVCLEQKGRT